MKALMKSLIATATVVAATGSAGVMAAPLTQLYFSQHAGWVNPTTDAAAETFFDSATTGLTFAMQGPLADPNAPANVYDSMQWTGVAPFTGTSSIDINTYNSSTSIEFVGNGDAAWEVGELWSITTLTQNNEVIGMNGFPNPLWVADVLANLRIYSDILGGTKVLQDLNSPTRISFWETFNNEAGCSNPNPAGTNCNDIYTLLTAELDDESFILNGYVYTIHFALVPSTGTVICQGNVGSVAACASLPNDNNTRIFTPEGQNSQINVGMSWSVQAVPEPSILALLGISLLGMGFARTRRQK